MIARLAAKSKSMAFPQVVSVPECSSIQSKSFGYEPFLFNGSVSVFADSLSLSISILRHWCSTIIYFS